MRVVRVIHAGLFMCSIGATTLLCGCEDSKPETGKQVTEDPKVAQDREKMIADQYKSGPPSKPASK
jgi:uncharacterized protein YaaQ